QVVSKDSNEAVNTVQIWEVATGRERCHFQGHRGTITSVAFSPDNQTVATGSEDTAILIWDLTGDLREGKQLALLSAKDLEQLWRDRADNDTGRAYRAILTVCEDPEKAVPFLKKHLAQLANADAKQVARLIKDLDSDEFEIREKAMEELEKLG